ncbi:hypothetical protein J2S46_001478 [Kitasatospora herbaricolor]|nr:hypothetical protein [Kitasatospora herbaricolor]MDQ0306922.1 hypothetical protein [Kitasatospora herbaricolor]
MTADGRPHLAASTAMVRAGMPGEAGPEFRDTCDSTACFTPVCGIAR